MKVLIAEDDFASSEYMLRFLSKYGECDITDNGAEAVEAFSMALQSKEGYDLVCLDIVMPKMDGYQVLSKIRELEKAYSIPEEQAAKIIMTSALSDGKHVTKAFKLGCTAYAGKPIDQRKFENVLRKLGLI
jgi:two-component system chemotaxis response regulator CheY